MDSKKRILIIHPEGNIVNNPNLFSIAQYLTESYTVDVLMPDIGLELEKEITFNVIYYGTLLNRIKHKINNYYLYKILNFICSFLLKNKYDFIFGIDRVGIIDAHFFANKFNCNYALISYEIFFEDETSKKYKKIEIKACSNVEFAVVQDEVRGEQLSKENSIELAKMLYIPVAGDGQSYDQKKQYNLHKKFGLSEDSKILIFTGSVSGSNCIDKLLDGIDEFLPQDWYLIIHDRYGQAEQRMKKLNIKNMTESKVLFIKNKVFSFDELQEVLNDADLGFIGYCPNYQTPHTGKNIKDIGLSSGKFSTYMQNGLPVIVYNSKDLGSIVEQNNLGFYVSEIRQLKEKLLNFTNRSDFKENCHKFYEAKLSFNQYKNLLKQKIVENI